MTMLVTIGRDSVATAGAAARLVTLPLRVGAAILNSPEAARRDPTSAQLAERRRRGWRPIAVRLGSRTTAVSLERDGAREELVGSTLAFAAYAVRVGVAASAPVTRDRAR